MKIHSIVADGCILIAGLCLGAAYLPGKYWLILPVLLAALLIRRIANRRLPFWISSTLLAVYVLLAAAGAWMNLSLPLILLGCVTALAGWESADFERGMTGNPSPESRMRMERRHLLLLAATSAAGLSLAFLSSYMDVGYPFGVTVFLVLLAVGSLTYSVLALIGKKSSG